MPVSNILSHKKGGMDQTKTSSDIVESSSLPIGILESNSLSTGMLESSSSSINMLQLSSPSVQPVASASVVEAGSASQANEGNIMLFFVADLLVAFCEFLIFLLLEKRRHSRSYDDVDSLA